MDATRIGKRGTVVIPAALRKQYGLEDGTLVIVAAHGDGVLIRPAMALAVETYTPLRKAEFLLSNAVDDEDYVWACAQVRDMGLDPEDVPHQRPPSG